MSSIEQRPPMWVGHISLSTQRLDESHAFMVALGMRPIFRGDEFAVLELRAGTHLILMEQKDAPAGDAPFDLMFDDLVATHARLAELGFSPTEISEGTIHSSFFVDDPGGQRIKFNSSHASGDPV